MRVNIVRRENYQMTRWSGGTTSQVMIWPETADFPSRKFIWRISLATLEVETSVFTPFPGFHRILYLLSGISRLTFRGIPGIVEQTAALCPGEQVRFDGNWETGSSGRASDLNLIMRQGVCGGIRTLKVGAGQETRWKRPILYAGPDSRCAYLLYVRSGALQVNGCRAVSGDSVFILAEGEAECLELVIQAMEESCALAECTVCWQEPQEGE